MAIRIIVSVITLCSCLAYWAVDHMLIKQMSDAVSRQEGIYGEMWGPLDYFHPKLFWVSVVGTIACIVLVVLPRRRNTMK